jgi:integrase
MPRPAKAARLYFRQASTRKDGRTEPAQWIIRDGKRDYRTKLAKDEIDAAERALDDYLARKHDPRASDPASAVVADALALYQEDVIDDPQGKIRDEARRREVRARLFRLNEFFGAKLIASIGTQACKDYVKNRGKGTGARREIEDLRAALNHFAEEGRIGSVPRLWLPEKHAQRTRWLTVREAAALLRAAWRMHQQYGVDNERRVGKHLARFILIALHTGTRRTRITTAALERSPGRPYFDLEHGKFYRRPESERVIKKNKNENVQTLPRDLLAHLRRWKRLGIVKRAAVEWNGGTAKKINKAFRHACEIAGLGTDVVPHTLRHTRVTWMLRAGKSVDVVANFVGMTREMVDSRYGHHCPDHQATAANARADERAKRRAG